MNLQQTTGEEETTEEEQQQQQQHYQKQLSLPDLAELCRSLHLANARKILAIEEQLEEYGYVPTDERLKEKMSSLPPSQQRQQNSINMRKDKSCKNKNGGNNNTNKHYLDTPEQQQQQQQLMDPMEIIGKPLDQVIEVEYETDATYTPGSRFESPPFSGPGGGEKKKANVPNTPATPATPTLESLQLSEYYISLYDNNSNNNETEKNDETKANPSSTAKIESVSICSNNHEGGGSLAGKDKDNNGDNDHDLEHEEDEIFEVASCPSDEPVEKKGESTDNSMTKQQQQQQQQQQHWRKNNESSGSLDGSNNDCTKEDESEDEAYDDSYLGDSAIYSDEYTEDLDDTHEMYSIASTVLAEHRRVKMEEEKNNAMNSIQNSEAQDVAVVNVLDDDIGQGNVSDDSDDTTVTEVSAAASSSSSCETDGNKKTKSSTPIAECSSQSVSKAGGQRNGQLRKAQTPSLLENSPLTNTFIDEYGDDESDMLVTPVPNRSLYDKREPGSGITPSSHTGRRLRFRLDSPKGISNGYDSNDIPEHTFSVIPGKDIEQHGTVFSKTENGLFEQTTMDDSILTMDTFESQNKYCSTPRPKTTPLSPDNLKRTPPSQFTPTYDDDNDGAVDSAPLTHTNYPKTPVIKISLVSENDDDDIENSSAITAQSAKVVSSKTEFDEHSSSDESDGDGQLNRTATFAPSTPHASVVESVVECNRDSGASSATEKTTHMTPKPSGNNTLQNLISKGSPLARTPLTAAWIAKHMPDEKDRLLSGLSNNESRFSSLLREKRLSGNTSSDEIKSTSASKEPNNEAKDGKNSLPLIKSLTAEEYDASLSVVKMQVTLYEVKSAVDALNSWFSQKHTITKDKKSEISESDAYHVLGETFSERKSKKLLMSLCHWRRLTMRPSSNGDRSKHFVVSNN